MGDEELFCEKECGNHPMENAICRVQCPCNEFVKRYYKRQ